VLLTAGAHRLVMQLNHNRDIRRVAYFENAALVAAGVKRDGSQAQAQTQAQDKEKSGLGSKETGNGTSTNGNGVGNVHGKGRRRKVKVPMVQGMEGAGYLELVVEGEHVYLVSNLRASVLRFSCLVPGTDSYL
jgi:DnaJ family protein C protein 1